MNRTCGEAPNQNRKFLFHMSSNIHSSHFRVDRCNLQEEKYRSYILRLSTQRLFQTLLRAYPGSYPTVKETLGHIMEACDICMEVHSPTFRFRESLPPCDITVNHELTIDLLWLDVKAVMHSYVPKLDIRNPSLSPIRRRKHSRSISYHSG